MYYYKLIQQPGEQGLIFIILHSGFLLLQSFFLDKQTHFSDANVLNYAPATYQPGCVNIKQCRVL